ncbi:MAG: hypothetical protein KatS3mg057_1583 [Herpetosiphonaceae bacterium]|nr:MAG: hypothetical protein KatS3mg057_1583 [Herpetosiphonaceae bacterium]
MNATVLSVTLASLVLIYPAQTEYVGFAAHYRPGLMTQVAHNRGMPLVDCMVASPFLPLGTWVTVESQKYGVRKICRVTDVAHPRDRENIIRRGIVIELDFQSATQICRISYYGQEPPRACPVIVSLYQPEETKIERPKPARPKPRLCRKHQAI